MRTVPCTELGCSRCREGRGGFQFPFVGTFAKRSIIVAAGATPAQAWHSYHQDGPERLSIELVFELGSGLWPTDFLPDHANRLIQNVCLERESNVLPRPCPRFVAASEKCGRASWPVYAAFTPGDQKIAQLELAMVLYALTARAHAFRGRRSFWYIDNVASLIRGRSTSPDLERLAQFALRASFFFEYIPSKTNWADAVSRIGFHDPWIHQRGFSCHVACFPFQLLDLPFLAVLRVFEFL